MTAETTARVRELIWKAVGAGQRALARGDGMAVTRADLRLEGLLDRLEAAVRRES